MMKRLSLLILVLLPFSVVLANDLPSGLPKAPPAELGLSAEKLEAMRAHFQAYVDDGRLAGLTTLVARHGKIADFTTYGAQSLEAGNEMPADAIFRIYSMTKPITGVALMILYEEGKFALDDPVSRYIPAFQDMRVFVGETGEGQLETVPAEREITIRDLMRHTAGLSYGVFSDTPVDRSYRKNELFKGDETLAEWVPRLAQEPLLYQPGKAWVYSLAVDVQGFLIEKLSGQALDEFFQTRIFEPLGMADTGFYVPAEDVSRLVGIYDRGKDGRLVPSRDPLLADFTKKPSLLSGGGGLVSTTRDYWRFAQMVANGGTLDGVQILKPETVAMMAEDQLPPEVDGIAKGTNGLGFGLDFAVVTDPAKFGGTGEEGEFFWGGMANTVFWIDPSHDIVAVLMTNVLPSGVYDVRQEMRRLVNAAIVE